MSAECDLNTVKEQRSLKIGIKSDKEFFGELKELAGRIDDGWLPEKSIERYHPAFAAEHSDVPWGIAYEMRNALTHGYFMVDMGIVWKTIENDLPGMAEQIENIANAD